MKLERLLAKAVLAIVIIIAFTSTAAARGMSLEVVEPGAVGIDPVYKTPSLDLAQPLQVEIFEKAPAIDMGFHPFDGKAPAVDMGFHPFDGKAPAVDMGFHPFDGKAPAVDMGFHPFDNDAARLSILWNAFPEPPQTEIFEKNPTDAVKQPPQCDTACEKNPTDAVKQPPQCDTACEKNPTDAVKQPPQCDTACEKNPTDAVKQPPQCDTACEKNPTDAVKQPPQCDTACEKNPTDAVKQPPQCDTACEKNPTDAVKQPPQCDTACEKNPTQAVREPLNIEFSGPTMKFELKEPTEADIAIYSVNGRLVRRFNARLSSGESSITWDGMSDRGGRAASGVYFARVQAGAQTAQGKLVVVR